MQVNCDSCKGEIKIELQTRRLPGDGAVEQSFFVCPHCDREYPTHYTDTEIRALQRKVSSLWEKFHKTKDLAKRESIQQQINEQQARIAADMDTLKELTKSEPG